MPFIALTEFGLVEDKAEEGECKRPSYRLLYEGEYLSISMKATRRSLNSLVVHRINFEE
jgi:hypothetical protein